MVNKLFYFLPMAKHLVSIGLLLSINAHLAFSQNYTFSPAIPLHDSINSIAEESKPILSPDGTKLFFVRTFHQQNVGGKYSGQDIWMSIRNDNNTWQPPTNDFPELNNSRNNAVIGINHDESAIFLTNAYNPINTTVLGVSRSIKIANYWSKPNDISIKGIDSKNSFIGFFMNKDEDVLIISMDYKNSNGKEDLYISLKEDDGNWTVPENLGTTINTNGFEISPFLSDDGKVLFFASDGHQGYGDSDIYMSRRLYDSWEIWTEPINLGSSINSTSFDAYFYLHDESEAYFASNRTGGLSNIYSSKVLALDTLKETAMLNENRYVLTETEVQELLGMPTSRNIYFEFGSSDVNEASSQLIDFLASRLQNKRQFHLELIGHTDKEGSTEFNLELSKNRAIEVSKFFTEYGIDSLRISTTGLGESKPVVKDGTKEEMAKNRRVEIFFVR